MNLNFGRRVSRSEHGNSPAMISTMLLAGLLVAGLGLPAHATDWPQWGQDASRNMQSKERGLPDRFDPGKLKPGTEEVDMATTRNVRWVAKLGSQTYGNVSVCGGKVWIGTNNDSPRDPQHEGDRGILLCLDEKSGELLWQLVVPKLASLRVNDWEYIGLVSSATIEGNRVYVVTSRCEVMCLDIHGMADGNQGPFKDEAQYVAGPGKPSAKIGPKDADIIWVYDMMKELGVFPHNASNCSVLIMGGLVYACTSNGQDLTHEHIPSPEAPSLIALDKKTGTFRGRDDARIGPRIFHSQWSSPAAGVVNGRPLIFFGAGDGVCYAFEAQPVGTNGASRLKTVWSFDINPPEYRAKDGKPIRYPAAEGPSEINATPVFYQNRIYVASGQDPEHGEGVGRLVCIDSSGTGDISRTGVIWESKAIHRSLSTVSIDPQTGLLFVGDFSGFVYCFDVETGRLFWVHDMKAHLWGSTLVADGKVYVGDEDGDFVVLAAAKEEQVLSETSFNGPVYSTPVAANGVLYVSTPAHLFAVHK